MLYVCKLVSIFLIIFHCSGSNFLASAALSQNVVQSPAPFYSKLDENSYSLVEQEDSSSSSMSIPNPIIEFVNKVILTPLQPSAPYITNYTHPLMVKYLLLVIFPMFCVVIAFQAYLTYFGPSNSYDGSWTPTRSPVS
ncbi:unnamed protein product [Orchesella dallaii]|uniref:Transmembrane protein n=1 Tax=Orchesella dallaii TaxID=48710 RepID=A0ABP1QUD8_9HEXA